MKWRNLPWNDRTHIRYEKFRKMGYYQESDLDFRFQISDFKLKDLRLNPESEKLEKALRFIKEGYIAGIIFGTYQVVFVIVATAEGDKNSICQVN